MPVKRGVFVNYTEAKAYIDSTEKFGIKLHREIILLGDF